MFKCTITVGLTDREGNELKDKRDLQLLKRDISLAFGGYTGFETQCGYTNDQGKFYEEPSYRLETLLSSPSLLKKLRSFVNWYLQATNQESALVEWEGHVEFWYTTEVLDK